MCLIIFAYQQRPDAPLILAANRDEFHARPTRAAGFWPDHPNILAGKDLQAGGTWFGVTRTGRFAAITNFRDPSRTAPAPRSRGELTLNFLLGEESPECYIAEVRAFEAEYAGFNLLLGDQNELWYYSNAGGGARKLEPGIYGLSNALLDTPWPKTELGHSALEHVLSQPPTHDLLAKVVANRCIASKEGLALQGLEGEMQQGLSAQFIVDPMYGTRATTTLWMGARGDAHFREVSYNGEGVETGRTEEILQA